jgi:hypothetical protein
VLAPFFPAHRQAFWDAHRRVPPSRPADPLEGGLPDLP